MRKFLIYISSVFLAVAVLMVACDFGYTLTYQKAKPRNKFEYILQMKPQKINYVFLGSSRTENHIVTSEVKVLTGESAINLGMAGAVFEDNLLQLKLLLDRKVKIEKLFLQVDYLYDHPGVSNIGNSMALPFIHNQVVKSHLESQMPNFNALYYIPFYRYLVTDFAIGFREFFFTMVGKKSKIDISDGFVPKNGSEPFQTFSFPKQIAAENKTITAFKNICKANKIELVLFCAPFCSKTENTAYIRKLKLNLPELHDYSTAVPDSLFYNCGHLNEKGAQFFTKKLIQDCVKNRQQ